jgi:hypothetical protein
MTLPVFLELGVLFQSDERLGTHVRGGRTARRGKEGKLHPAFLRDGILGPPVLQPGSEQIRDDLFQSAVFVERPEFDGTHEFAGQIDRCFHTPSLLVCWLAVKKWE